MLESLPLLLASLTTIFGWSFFSFWSAIPAGIALTVPPILVGLTATISYGCGVLLVVVVGEPIRNRLRKRMQSDTAGGDTPEPNRMVTWVMQAWERFGLVGLAILAPMTVGAQIGAVIGLGFGARPWRLVVAMTVGAGIWAIFLTVAIVAGVMTIV